MNATDPADDVSGLIATFRDCLGPVDRPLALVARFGVAAGTEETVREAFVSALPATLRDPGCLAFHVHTDPRVRGQLLVYERWASLADLEAHLRTPHTTKLRRELQPCIVGEPEFVVLEPFAATE
jgi:quinol monooxygenase YgiN